MRVDINVGTRKQKKRGKTNGSVESLPHWEPDCDHCITVRLCDCGQVIVCAPPVSC